MSVYQTGILSLLSNDPDFLLYLGNQRVINNEEERSRLKTSRDIILRNSNVLDLKINIIEEGNSSDKNKNHNENNKEFNFYKKEYMEKEINNILDEYKAAYPIKRKMKNLFNDKELNAINFIKMI